MQALTANGQGHEPCVSISANLPRQIVLPEGPTLLAVSPLRSSPVAAPRPPMPPATAGFSAASPFTNCTAVPYVAAKRGRMSRQGEVAAFPAAVGALKVARTIERATFAHSRT
jgi:hypothetical protein